MVLLLKSSKTKAEPDGFRLLVLGIFMDQKQAILEMKKGKKVTHKNFCKGEWMTIDNGLIVFEDGTTCDQIDFWRWRIDNTWITGYSIWRKP